MGRVTGFRTRGKGKRHKHYPVTARTHREYVRIHRARKPHAQKIDESMKAKLDKVKWLKDPSRHDVKGVDTPGGVREPEPRKRSKIRQPRNTSQAVRAIANREIPVSGSSVLQREYNRVNKEHFKSKLPEVTIMLADLPKVKHQGFTVPEAKILIINTAKCKTLENRKAVLRHEMIHNAGIKGHGTLFSIYAEAIDAPVREYEGKLISSEEYMQMKIKREVEKEKAETRRREKRFGAKKGEGIKKQDGKTVARVWAYENRGRFVMPSRRQTTVPKTATNINLILFDNLGYPKRPSKGGHVQIERGELDKYYLVP